MRRRETSAARWLWTAAGAVVILGMSYGLALAGEPQSVWFWRDVLGVIR